MDECKPLAGEWAWEEVAQAAAAAASGALHPRRARRAAGGDGDGAGSAAGRTIPTGNTSPTARMWRW